MARTWIKTRTRLLMLMIVLLPRVAAAEPIKLSLVSSDRSLIYLGGVKPFVDAVNAEAKGLLEIDVYFSGALGKSSIMQPQLVDDGVADIAFIFPGYSAERFPDDAVIELPGLFRDAKEASLVFTRLIAAGALQGYGDYVVIAAVCSPPEIIHARVPIGSIADLHGMSIRTNNAVEAAALRVLGMHPVPMPVDQAADAISNGRVDSSTGTLAMLFEFGIGRVASNHYAPEISGVPLALVMNRAVFERLPLQAQDIIRKYSGEWSLTRYLQTYETATREVRAKLDVDPRRKVVVLSHGDLDTAHAAFVSMTEQWLAESPDHRRKLDLAAAEIAKLRAGSR